MTRLVADARRIGVLRANALGDFIVTLPALDALRAAYPDATITLIGRDWHAEFLRSRPGPVDEVFAVPHGALGDERDVFLPDVRRETIERLREKRFDICLQLHGGGRNTNPFVAQLGARVTAGARTADAPMLDRNIHYDVLQPDLVRALETCALVGAPFGPLAPRLSVTAEDIAASLAVVPETDQPLAVVHPGASDTRRRWPADRFAEVCDALARAGARVVLTGIASERPVVDAVGAVAVCDHFDAAGTLSLSALTGLLSRAAVLVSNDTGPRHVASAVGTPTVSIYWVGNVITAGPLLRDRNRVLVSWNLLCPECGRNCVTDDCGHRPSFVTDVPVDAVVAEARDLLENARKHPVAVASQAV